MASLRKTKKANKKQLERDTQKVINEVNARLRELQKGGYSNTWASNKLVNKLDTEVLNVVNKPTRAGRKVGKGGKISKAKAPSLSLKQDLTKTQLVAVQKASKQFLKSQTSTVAGVKKAVKSNIEGIQKRLSTAERGKVSEEDAEMYYKMFQDKDFADLSNKIKYDALFDLIDEANSKETSEEDWIEMIGRYITTNDSDIKEKAIKLYNKYVSQ